MKKFTTLLFFIFLYHFAFSQSWNEIPNMTGEVRGRSGTFSIGDTGYVIAGGHFWYLPSSFGYDSLARSWFEIADYPGYDDDPMGCSISGKGYCVTGGSCCPAYSNSLYEYDPGTNTWNTSLPPLPGPARTFAVSFAVGGKFYVGGGVNNTGTPSNSNPLTDFYSYDPATNIWDTIAPCPAAGVSAFPVGFAINGKGYVGTGGKVRKGDAADNYIPQQDFWEYDPTNNTWTQKANFGGGPRCGAVGWATCDKGYIATGYTDSLGNDYTNDCWQYDPVQDKWTQVASYPGIPRKFANVFVIGNTGFVGDGSTPTDTSDFYEYHADYFPAFTTANSTTSTICAGNSISFSDTSNYDPIHWQWNFPGGTPDTSTSQNPTIKYDTVGTFSVILSAWNGCDSATKTFINYVTVTAAPIISITPDSPSVCSGGHITLTASGALSYRWINTTDTTDSIIVYPTVDTTYELFALNGTCSVDTFISVNVNIAPPLVVQPPSPETVCLGQSIILSVSASGTDYTWNPSSTLNPSTGNTVTATPLADITYTVTGTDSLGCNVSGTEVIDVTSGPSKPTITQHDSVLISSSTQSNQWLRNDTTIQGATNQDYIVTIPGYYQVTVSNPANGCSTTSDSLYASGINQLIVESGQLTVYPNPTGGEIMVNISSSVGGIRDWNLQVTDVLGRILFTKSLLNYSNVIDLSDLSNGMYFISVINKTGRAVVPVVKQ